ncbi:MULTISPECIES: helix-turn-helix domain-containing protein [Eubacteriales]|uniref:helix-turn-helix domain-containing protein n=1 Tax=Eubacteriales TaxID=186802 RepID=UPI000821A3B8|nr:helix-turn-helix domain-containing protein [Muriventricola aceti]MCU6704146.1 helix-turn-helix domain-containing protein [Muriventricola aceti]SCJ69981.1 DNA binding domain%2C excisionase family [uncultured Flavonifractor sp.]
MEQKEKELQLQTRAYTVEEIATVLHIGRSSTYTLVKKWYFKSVRIGTAIRISRKSFDEWLNQFDL